MYVTPEEVRAFTGIGPDDLDVADEVALDLVLAGWAVEVRDMIDRDRSRDFLAEAGGVLDDVPALVRSVAKRAMANYVQLARASRESALIRVDEWRVAFEQKSQVLTADLRAELARAFGSGRLRRLRMFVSHGADDQAATDA